MLATAKLSIPQQQTQSTRNLSRLSFRCFLPSPTEMSSSLLLNTGWEVASVLQGRIPHGFPCLLLVWCCQDVTLVTL